MTTFYGFFDTRGRWFPALNVRLSRDAQFQHNVENGYMDQFGMMRS